MPYQNSNSQQASFGALFNNRNSKTSPNAPDVRGTLTIDGVEYNIAGWDAKGQQSGKPYLRIKATPKQ